MRNDRDNWRSKPKQESGVLTNIETEAQQCGMRLLFFAQSSMVSLSDAIEGSCGHLLEQDLKMASTIEKKKALAFAPLEGRAELLLNHCAQAIVVRSLSLLQHFQHRNDYTPKVAKGADAEVIAPPCTRACTLFCKYIAQQFERAKEFINAPSGGIPHRTGSFQAPSSDQGTASNQLISSNTSPRSRQFWSENHCIHGGAPGNSSSGSIGAFLSAAAASDLLEADRSRARKMGMQQLLFGDGAPSPFVRTIGVCLYRGISVHLKNYSVSDRGALVYKQDVTAYVEAMQPLARSAGLGGAVVDVLFRLLKETASLMIMPPDHLKGVWNTGLLRLLSNEEKVQIIKMRVDLHDNFRDVVK
uniref:Uncharacterized protein TCIL3000_8_2370 n=1 Tax=Trypanosoma congolense (strain IL3000) TaxID=1068625 RepID=G0URK6_TRYCI|nr:unnamed protein product [Trypanosoma congolense IL3000]